VFLTECQCQPTFQLRTWQYIPEDFELHTSCHENLKSHMETAMFAETLDNSQHLMRLTPESQSVTLKLANTLSVV
jgi:hypothetical protein